MIFCIKIENIGNIVQTPTTANLLSFQTYSHALVSRFIFLAKLKLKRHLVLVDSTIFS